MFQRRGQARVRDMVLLGGWLFADLLLGLMVIFLISIKGGSLPLPSCGTPTIVQPATALQTGIGSVLLGGNTTNGNALGSAGKTAPTPTTTACPTPTPTQTPTNCGLDQTGVDSQPFTLADPNGLRQDSPTAQASFDAQVRTLYAAYAGKTAGLVEIFGGGGGNVGFGINFAKHANTALLLPANAGFIFDSKQTVFQDFADVGLNTSQMEMIVFFYQTSATGRCGSSQP